MSTYGIMVARNESDRYLSATVAWLNQIVDALVVFDDQSTDDTAEVALAAGAIVKFRSYDCPSFLDNESQFRQAAWLELGRCVHATTDDWVISVDADEFIISHADDDARGSVAAAIDYAESEGAECVDLPVAEVFDMVGPRPMVRTDGEWSKIRAARLCRWQNRPVFADRVLAGGSLPKMASPPLRLNDPVLLHCGYADPSDKQAKWERYHDRDGHSSGHVDSILKTGIYEPWSSPVPESISRAIEERLCRH